MRLRTRFAVTFFVAGALMLLAVALVHEEGARRLLEGRAQARAEALAEWLARAAEPATADPVALQAAAAPLTGLPSLLWARVESPEGRVLLDLRAPGGAAGPAVSGSAALAEGGRALVAVTTAPIDRTVGAMLKRTQAAGLAAAAALALLSWVLGTFLGRRLEASVSEIESLAGFGPEPEGRAGPETGRLGRAVVRLKDALRQRQDRQEELQRLRAELADMMVHDLKHPLTVLRMALSVIKEHSDAAGPRAAASFGMAERAVTRLDAMITTLLQLARIESAEAPVRRERVSIGDLLRACAEENAFLVAQSARRWAVEVESGVDLMVVQADRPLIGRLLGNLVINAVDHGAPDGRVTLGARRASRDKGRIELFVSDDGPGLDEAAALGLFARFSTSVTDSARHVGLGLAFCQLAAERHGSRMEVVSAPGRGATFLVSLPASAPQAATLSASRLGSSAAPGGRG